MVGMTKVTLFPGQFVFGRLKAAEDIGLPESTVRDCVKWLKNNRSIDINPTNKFSVVSVINWETYQSTDTEPDSKPDSKPDNSPTTARHKQEHKEQ